MERYDVVVVGGGPAGVSAAISAHNTYPNKTIALIRKEKVALIPCGIPYTQHSLESVAADTLPDKLVTEAAGAQLIIDQVMSKSGKTLTLASGKQVHFDKLVLATGASPVKPKMEGIELEGIYLCPKCAEALQQMRDAAQVAKHILIVGGGYIGVELADEYIKAGKQVTLVEMQDQLLPMTMDPEFGAKASELLEQAGAQVRLGHRVMKFEGNGQVQSATLDDGSIVPAEMVLVCIGARPNVELASQFGLEYDERAGIRVDEYLRSSQPDIFVIGDSAAKNDFFTGRPSEIRLASTAMAEGRLVGSNLFEIKVIRKYIGVMGSFATKICGTAFGVSGLTENRAKEMNLDYRVGQAITVDRHPGNLPGASPLHLKLIFARYSHVLLGAEVHGGDSVGELVNMLSVMILNKMTDMDIDTLQIGTHPLLTASPIAYPVITATVNAIGKWYQADAA